MGDHSTWEGWNFFQVELFLGGGGGGGGVELASGGEGLNPPVNPSMNDMQCFLLKLKGEGVWAIKLLKALLSRALFTS